MKLLTYSEPGNEAQIGALMEDGKTIAALQAGAVAMEGAPQPYFRDMLSLLRGGPPPKTRPRQSPSMSPARGRPTRYLP